MRVRFVLNSSGIPIYNYRILKRPNTHANNYHLTGSHETMRYIIYEKQDKEAGNKYSDERAREGETERYRMGVGGARRKESEIHSELLSTLARAKKKRKVRGREREGNE